MRKGSSCSFSTKNTWMELEPEIRMGMRLSSHALGKVSM